jgi:hypothetical protein
MRAMFPTTRYSVVAATRDPADTAARQAALDTITATYWKPTFKYIRYQWHADPADAADLTQGFFLWAVEHDYFAAFDRAKARFRTYVRLGIDGFVGHERERAARLKRGGGKIIVSLDFAAAEEEYQRLAPGGAELDGEQRFHHDWLRELVVLAADRLRHQLRERGAERRYQLFARAHLVDDPADRPPCAELAREFAIPATTVTNELAAARRQFRAVFLDVLREQCCSEDELRAELRALNGRTRVV